jgi:hypothetical protein
LTCFIAKEMSAQQALELGAPIFPFRKGEMDIMSLTLMATFGAIGMGTCKGDLEKFKLGAFVAYLNTAISYPVIMGTLYAYKEIMYPLVYQPLAKNYDLWNTEQCVAYSKASNPSYSVFTDEQLAPICKTLPISMIGQLIQFGATHLLIFACIYVVYKNRELYAYNDALTSRKSMVLDDALSYSVHAYGLLDGEENYNDNNDTNEYTITNTPPTKHRSRSVRRPSNIGGRMVRSGSTYRGRNLTRQSISYLASDASVTSSPKRTTDIEEINAQYNRLYSPETDNNNNSNNLEEQNQQDNAQDAITTYSGRLFGQVSDEENQPVISSESH